MDLNLIEKKVKTYAAMMIAVKIAQIVFVIDIIIAGIVIILWALGVI